ncbi:Hypothetical predicted protein [Pelobates cultripes]|uniref:Uncharacterized protein n=1 Tax=Pelobates cultripes TaxID=61616 RepID=A0AAD1SGV6_PELCU|nr:Hypothetical predicted protein [Pelobates cultripes]
MKDPAWRARKQQRPLKPYAARRWAPTKSKPQPCIEPNKTRRALIQDTETHGPLLVIQNRAHTGRNRDYALLKQGIGPADYTSPTN